VRDELDLGRMAAHVRRNLAENIRGVLRLNQPEVAFGEGGVWKHGL
jgi:hypothetical protein